MERGRKKESEQLKGDRKVEIGAEAKERTKKDLKDGRRIEGMKEEEKGGDERSKETRDGRR